MEKKIRDHIEPDYLLVDTNDESHFKVVVVSDKFVGMSPVERHRMINNLMLE